jgi:peptidoglycan L-alanyl-D-glutamate endopeptidase CwlK
MINSRKLEYLQADVRALAEKLIALCHDDGIDLIITSTYRDYEAQDALYAIGRTKPGKKVTNAKGGESYHNFKVAFDVVPIVGGKCVWDDNELWKKLGALGKSLGLEWAGDWKSFKELCHFQLTNGRTLADFRGDNK